MAAIQPLLIEKKPRRQYSPEEKVRILRLHLLEGKAGAEICEREAHLRAILAMYDGVHRRRGCAYGKVGDGW